MRIDAPNPNIDSKYANLLTLEDVAKRLRVSKTTAYRLVESRKIAFYRLSGALRFSERDIDEYLGRARVASIHEYNYGHTKN